MRSLRIDLQQPYTNEIAGCVERFQLSGNRQSATPGGWLYRLRAGIRFRCSLQRVRLPASRYTVPS